MAEIGYALSSEEHGPRTLVENAAKAESIGFDFLMVSDHFHPWTDTQGNSPFVWGVIGGIAEVTERVWLGTGVTCPTIRIHPAIIAQAAATSAALMQGRASDDPQRSYSGDRPSATILLERLDARSLGALIAFYEHRTFANAVLLGTNPFDQFGVELGKEIARQLGEGADDSPLDPSTRALIERAGI